MAKQSKRIGAHFLTVNGRTVGTCQTHGYLSLPVALLAAYEQAKDTRHAIVVAQWQAPGSWKYIAEVCA